MVVSLSHIFFLLVSDVLDSQFAVLANQQSIYSLHWSPRWNKFFAFNVLFSLFNSFSETCNFTVMLSLLKSSLNTDFELENGSIWCLCLRCRGFHWLPASFIFLKTKKKLGSKIKTQHWRLSSEGKGFNKGGFLAVLRRLQDLLPPSV